MQRLQINSISKTYSNGVKALNNVSLNVSNGMFGLLGPNGAGKSSLMRTLATLQYPDNGQILFDGKDIFAEPQQLKRQLGYLPQDFGVYPKLSALELLNHMAILKGILNKTERKEQVQSLLQQTNLYEVRKHAVSSFSGGMRQRFGIAQALLGNPQLLIVDEPTAGLDPLERNRFHHLLTEIGEQVVVILSTHIVEDVHDLCPEMAVMANGQVVLQGKPGQLTELLRGRVWKKNVSKAALEQYQQNLQLISTRISGGRFEVHVLSDTCPDTGFEQFEADIEDVYFSSIAGIIRSGKEVAAC